MNPVFPFDFENFPPLPVPDYTLNIQDKLTFKASTIAKHDLLENLTIVKVDNVRTINARKFYPVDFSLLACYKRVMSSWMKMKNRKVASYVGDCFYVRTHITITEPSDWYPIAVEYKNWKCVESYNNLPSDCADGVYFYCANSHSDDAGKIVLVSCMYANWIHLLIENPERPETENWRRPYKGDEVFVHLIHKPQDNIERLRKFLIANMKEMYDY